MWLETKRGPCKPALGASPRLSPLAEVPEVLGNDLFDVVFR